MRINFYSKQNIYKSPLLILLFLWGIIGLSFISVSVSAQSSFNGLFQNYNAFQTLYDNELIAGRNRLRINFSKNVESVRLFSEIDLINRYVEFNDRSPNAEFRFRELYFDWYLDNYDIRVGKQNIIWGRADGGFITDILTPVDLREFLTQDPEDLRSGVSAINITRYSGPNSFQFILNPAFQRDLFPEPGSRWFPIQSIDSPVTVNFTRDDDPPSLKNIQLATQFRIRSVSDLDLDLMLYYWTHPMPAYAVEPNFFNPPNLPNVDLIETYKPSWMAGYSLNYQIASEWNLTAETLFVKDRIFTYLPVPVSVLENALTDIGSAIQVLQEFELRDDGYLLIKPWLQSMVGLQTTVKETVVSAQFYLETIIDYEEKILPQQYFPYATLFVNRSFYRERLQMVALARYNFYAEDYWFQLQGIYELSDGLELAMGTNLFAGEEISPFYGHFTFNQFRENSFIFSRIAFYF